MLTRNKMLKTPNTAVKLKEEGNQFFNKKRYVEALACYNQAIQLNKNLETVWLNKALCHRQLKQTQEALEALTQAIAIKTNYAKAVYNKGELLNSIQLFEQSLETIDRYLTQGGGDTEVILLREKTAENYVKQLLGKKVTMDPVQLFSLGQQSQAQHQLIEAKNFFNAVIALERTHELARKKLVEVKAGLDDSTENTLSPLAPQVMQGTHSGKEKQLIHNQLNSTAQPKESKLYFYVKQDHYCCWEYNPAFPESFTYGFYTEKFFNCIILTFRSVDKKKIAIFHAGYVAQLQDIQKIIGWVGHDCTKIAYMKEHAEADESLEHIFKDDLNLKKKFTFNIIRAERKKGKIVLDPNVGRLSDGSLAPEFEQDVVWIDCDSSFSTKYHSTYPTCDDDRILKVRYLQFQSEGNQIFANKAGNQNEDVLMQMHRMVNSEAHLIRLRDLILSDDYGNLRFYLDWPAQNVDALIDINGTCYSLLALAAVEGKTRLVELLLSRGASVDMHIKLPLGTKGGTALFMAAGRGHINIVKKLIAAGANPWIKTAQGNTPISIAKQQGRVDVVLFLEEIQSRSSDTNPRLQKSIALKTSQNKAPELPLTSEADGYWLRKTKIEDTSLIMLLNEKTTLKWYGLCDNEYYVDAVTDIADEKQVQEAKKLQTNLNGYGRFFVSSKGDHFLIENINAVEKDVSIGQELQKYLFSISNS